MGMLKTYKGSCHCGAVCFEADLDFSTGTTKCNCSICAKRRLWAIQAKPDAFRLVAGEVDLTDFQGGNKVAHHLFCNECGVHPFEWVDMPNMTGHLYYNINIACLDDLDVDELMTAPITYCDGRNNDWGTTPAEIRHL